MLPVLIVADIFCFIFFFWYFTSEGPWKYNNPNYEQELNEYKRNKYISGFLFIFISLWIATQI